MEKEAGTNERNALEALKGLCESWIAGNASLSAWQGTDGKAHFDRSLELAEVAAGTPSSAGYYKEKEELVALSEEAGRALESRVSDAEAEIARKTRYTGLIESGTAHLNERKAIQSMHHTSSILETELFLP